MSPNSRWQIIRGDYEQTTTAFIKYNETLDLQINDHGPSPKCRIHVLIPLGMEIIINHNHIHVHNVIIQPPNMHNYTLTILPDTFNISRRRCNCYTLPRPEAK